jgi:hypothetical protein
VDVLRAGWNVPLELPSNTLTLRPLFAVARSRIPSLLKSPDCMPMGDAATV